MYTTIINNAHAQRDHVYILCMHVVTSYVHVHAVYLFIFWSRCCLYLQICCQFDFKRLPGSKTTCPWKIKPQPITDSNVHDRYKNIKITYHTKSCIIVIVELHLVIGCLPSQLPDFFMVSWSHCICYYMAVCMAILYQSTKFKIFLYWFGTINSYISYSTYDLFSHPLIYVILRVCPIERMSWLINIERRPSSTAPMSLWCPWETTFAGTLKRKSMLSSPTTSNWLTTSILMRRWRCRFVYIYRIHSELIDEMKDSTFPVCTQQ